ncbi:MAG: HupE/UreJ family protein, partial [Bacteroidota bacterium]|nr:HupE/UreJ family protein [Bacteroidota bacterium]
MKKPKVFFTVSISIIFLFISKQIFAHPIHDLDKLSTVDIGWVYVQLGFTHILPYGLDHILFVLGLFLL